MIWQEYLGAVVMALVYVRLAWMLVHPRHKRSVPMHSR